MLFSTLFVALYTTATAYAYSPGHSGALRLRDHRGITNLTETRGLEKRFSAPKLTVFDDSIGACGDHLNPSEMFVALSYTQYDNGAHCHNELTISYKGKTATATVKDECMGCAYGSLDLSRALWEYLSDHAPDGELYGATWSFGDGGGDDTPPPVKHQSSSTTHTTHKPTTTSKTTTSTSTHKSTSMTTASSSKSSSTSKVASSSSSSVVSSSAAINFSSGVASGIAIPTGTAAVYPDQSSGSSVLSQFNLAMINLGGLVAAANDLKEGL